MPRIRLLALRVGAALLLGAPAAHGASSGVVVSQVYAGGGNAGATYTNDFVELLNRSSAAVDLTGWTVQYAPAGGTSWQATALSGSIAPGHLYLVQLASAAAVGATPPAPDATGTTNLAVSGGKVALVRDASALACGASPGSCSANPLVEDLVGYGAAVDYEGSGPAPALSSTTAAARASGGCADTGDNAADFSAETPAPRNSSSAAVSCTGGGSPPPSTSSSQGATVDIDIQSLLSIALERPSLSFGSASSGQTPSPISERVTVVSNDAAGYTLGVHRSAFAPADLPLGLGASAPAGGQLGGGLGGAAIVPIPIAPAADLLLGGTAAASALAGDVWATSVGFAAPLPVVGPGHYTATITYTVIGK